MSKRKHQQLKSRASKESHDIPKATDSISLDNEKPSSRSVKSGAKRSHNMR
jgi:hypothetical protein